MFSALSNVSSNDSRTLLLLLLLFHFSNKNTGKGENQMTKLIGRLKEETYLLKQQTFNCQICEKTKKNKIDR